MQELPGDELEETRAALAPTLEATAAILPWVAKPKALRFAPDINERWIGACARLRTAWSGRYGPEGSDLRTAIFALYAIAIETGDTDCLRLGEALASAADQLEIAVGAPALIAALSASVEALIDDEGLENLLFPERARHFATRLVQAADSAKQGATRSLALDRLFAAESRERIEHMHEALDALPLDIYALKLEADEMAQHAEQLELFGIVYLCRELLGLLPAGGQPEMADTPAFRACIERQLQGLSEAISALDA